MRVCALPVKRAVHMRKINIDRVAGTWCITYGARRVCLCLATTLLAAQPKRRTHLNNNHFCATSFRPTAQITDIMSAGLFVGAVARSVRPNLIALCCDRVASRFNAARTRRNSRRDGGRDFVAKMTCSINGLVGWLVAHTCVGLLPMRCVCDYATKECRVIKHAPSW